MLDKNYIPADDARQLLIDRLAGITRCVERLPLEKAFDRVLAEDIIAPEDLPGFARSTVDGYAVRSRDTFGARDTSPAYLNLAPEILMGSVPAFALRPGEAAPIPTGGMLPEGADAVVMFEHCQKSSESLVEILHAAAPAENVVQKDEDVKAGQSVLVSGSRLRPQDVGALAGLGIASVAVFAQPVVAIVSTGDEVVPLGSPCGPAQVRDINSFTLRGLIAHHGGIPVWEGICRDEYETIRSTVAKALQKADLVLIVGGTSAGVRDMSASVIDSLGEPGVLFHGVALKPGKPLIGGMIGPKPVLGLPGHPAAVVGTFESLVRPVLACLCGMRSVAITSRAVTARITKSVASVAGREDHIRVRLEDLDGELCAIPVLGKSGLITTLVRADGIVKIPAPKLGLDAGESVAVHLFS